MATTFERLCFKEYGLQHAEVLNLFGLSIQGSWWEMLRPAQPPFRSGSSNLRYLPEENHQAFLLLIHVHALDRAKVAAFEVFTEWYQLFRAAEIVSKMG